MGTEPNCIYRVRDANQIDRWKKITAADFDSSTLAFCDQFSQVRSTLITKGVAAHIVTIADAQDPLDRAVRNYEKIVCFRSTDEERRRWRKKEKTHVAV
jgi:hypothetical protein